MKRKGGGKEEERKRTGGKEEESKKKEKERETNKKKEEKRQKRKEKEGRGSSASHSGRGKERRKGPICLWPGPGGYRFWGFVHCRVHTYTIHRYHYHPFNGCYISP